MVFTFRTQARYNHFRILIAVITLMQNKTLEDSLFPQKSQQRPSASNLRVMPVSAPPNHPFSLHLSQHRRAHGYEQTYFRILANCWKSAFNERCYSLHKTSSGLRNLSSVKRRKHVTTKDVVLQNGVPAKCMSAPHHIYNERLSGV